MNTFKHACFVKKVINENKISFLSRTKRKLYLKNILVLIHKKKCEFYKLLIFIDRNYKNNDKAKKKIKINADINKIQNKLLKQKIIVKNYRLRVETKNTNIERYLNKMYLE
ncbi:hypothetical protein BNATCHR185 (nucleomorph) [Bigelowiella natans]|uniref:Uncharacterized protein n=1 Tax=Bigelowiella natans TaxID=227086 RepID=Q3LWM3_BIGNA|nr:hypothetical protein BNATCHR185 [Bigelowiella natans]ABA27143.1 hypothetical protein [Bigelowiella natans]